ncbi:sugar ABC transporter permease [Microbacterium sp. cx-55]|uniref:carbohydrate ABC transporter permease n=1 Tax=Microbacterium sp. cx-55 TaxID=2875948 RepID=UPI001CBDDC18|nr:sugar ABC transporter permease [Microbacterium sp. cx-55]MBZ4487761.1 sugar ABC transporter permease [Microbacterium sp. cx-55]UGB34827.1 sugar ABC transporter permease [Microbacterium sp. cx-55]
MTVLSILIGTVLVPAAVILLTAVGERLLARARPVVARRIRPWFWLAPVIIGVGVVLVYPAIATLVLSFRSADSSAWTGLDNYLWALGSDVLPLFVNNAIWIIALPLGIVIVATIMAVMIDRVRYELVARTLLVLPTAISLTAAGISWRLLYTWAPEGRTQLGAFNAALQAIGFSPVPWTSRPPTDAPWLNTLALVVVGVWAGLGVAVLILSAAVKAVPAEYLEAARLDGAGEFRVFFLIVLPVIWPSMLTVITTQVIAAIKVFDIVYVMTNGNAGTDVVANEMFGQLFHFPNDIGHASSLAVLLLVLALPVVWFNVRAARREMNA